VQEAANTAEFSWRSSRKLPAQKHGGTLARKNYVPIIKWKINKKGCKEGTKIL
jgi:hypothetical protein